MTLNKYILFFIILIIIYSPNLSYSYSYSDSILVFINSKDINKGKVILSNGEEIKYGRLRIEFITDDSIATMIKKMDGMHPKGKTIIQEYSNNYNFLLNKGVAYFPRELQKIKNKESNDSFFIYLIISFLIIFLIMLYILYIKLRDNRYLKSEKKYLINKIEKEYKPEITKFNQLKKELIGPENNVNNPLGEINEVIINERKKLNDKKFYKLSNNQKVRSYNLLLSHLNDLFSICCRFLKLEYYGKAGEREEFNTKFHFTTIKLDDNCEIQIVNCGWRDSDTKEVLKKAYVKQNKMI